nr:hypothetical protein [Tanacetum cinerariifolium]
SVWRDLFEEDGFGYAGVAANAGVAPNGLSFFVGCVSNLVGTGGCIRSVAKDNGMVTNDFALRVNTLVVQMNEACSDRISFVQELRSVAGETVPAKTVLFLEKMIDKEGNREWQLRALKKEAREMAFDIESFLLKLMDEKPSHMRVFGGDDGQRGCCCAVMSTLQQSHMVRMYTKMTNVALLFVAIWGRQQRIVSLVILYRRPLIIELHCNADSSDWTDVLSYFCRKAAAEDRRFATNLNTLREEMENVYEKRRNLAYELRSDKGIIVAGKAAEFVTDTLRKDNGEMAQLLKFSEDSEFSCFKLLIEASECMCLALEAYRIQAMAALPICDKLRQTVNSSDWEVMFILRCRREIAEDLRLAREINALCARLTAVIYERENFKHDLDVLAGRRVPVKMSKFMRVVQGKDIPNLMKLHILEREFELRAREKDIS